MNIATKKWTGFVIAFAIISAIGVQPLLATTNAESLRFDPFTRLTVMQQQIASLQKQTQSPQAQKALTRLHRRLARRHRLTRLVGRMDRRMARIRVVSVSAVVEPYNVLETSNNFSSSDAGSLTVAETISSPLRSVPVGAAEPGPPNGQPNGVPPGSPPGPPHGSPPGPPPFVPRRPPFQSPVQP